MTISRTKWRELLFDPFDMDLGSDLVLTDVIGYPHAGNDVLLCEGLFQNEAMEFYLKIARHKDANLSNEAAVLSYLDDAKIPVPQVLSYGVHGDEAREFLAISAMSGNRMSGTLSEPNWALAKADIKPYLTRIAESLLQIHKLHIDWEPVRHRTQFSIPAIDNENPSFVWLRERINWLEKHKPSKCEKCFVHGDHHYANLLWERDEISAVLDWELCGIGWREFDIAWSILPRPGQEFFTTMAEQCAVLETYETGDTFDFFSVVWCFTLIATHFMSIKSLWQDREYHLMLMELCQEYNDCA